MAKKKKKAAKWTKARKSSAKAGKEVLVVASKVKGYVKGKGMMCGGEVIQAVSDCVQCCLDRAMKRARANRRRTVKAQDV